MQRSTTISVRINPDLKKKAEEVLDSLEIPLSSAINMFLEQVVLNKGIPFEIKMPLDLAIMSVEDIDKELDKAYDDIKPKRYEPLEDVMMELNEDSDL